MIFFNGIYIRKVRWLFGVVLVSSIFLGTIVIETTSPLLLQGVVYLALLPGWSIYLTFMKNTNDIPTLWQVSVGALIVLSLTACMLIFINPKRYSFSQKQTFWLVVGLHIGILFLLILPLLSLKAVELNPDAVTYMTWALNLAKGHGYTELEEMVTRRGPVHAFMLAIPFWLFSPSPDAGLITSKLVGILNIALIYWMGIVLFKNHWAGFIGSLLVISCEAMMTQFFSLQMLDGTLALFVNLSLLTFYLALERKNYWLFALVGFFQGIAILTKELGVIWVALPWIFLIFSPRWYSAKNFIGLWLMTLVLIFTLYPWFAYVFQVSGQLFFLREGQNILALLTGFHLGLLIYIISGIYALQKRDAISKFFSELDTYQQKSIQTGIKTLGFILLATSIASIIYYFWGNISKLTLPEVIQYFQIIMFPVLGSLFWIILLAWGVTLVFAQRSDPHRLLAIMFLLTIPIFLMLSQRGWQSRNFFGIFLLSYLLLGHYLAASIHWLARSGNATSKHLLYVKNMVVVVSLALLITGSVNSITSQVIANKLQQEKYGDQVLLRDWKGQLSAATASWITNHVEAGESIVAFTEAWPSLTYFLLRGQYPFYAVPYERMNANQFSNYLLDNPNANIFYIQHARDYYPIFDIYLEQELYRSLRQHQARYIILGGKHMSLMGTTDFFELHPAFKQVFEIESGWYGEVIYEVDLAALNRCAFCPVVIDDWSYLHFQEIANKEGFNNQYLDQILQSSLTISFQPNVFTGITIANNLDKLNSLDSLGLLQDITLYLEKLKELSHRPPEQALLADVYKQVGYKHKSLGNKPYALIAFERAVFLTPALRPTLDKEIQTLSVELIDYYSHGKGTNESLPPVIARLLPVVAVAVAQERGQDIVVDLADNYNYITQIISDPVLKKDEDKFSVMLDYIRKMNSDDIRIRQLLAAAYVDLAIDYLKPGEILDQTERVNKAIISFQTAISLVPNRWDMRADVINGYITIGDRFFAGYLRQQNPELLSRAITVYLMAAYLRPEDNRLRSAITKVNLVRADPLPEFEMLLKTTNNTTDTLLYALLDIGNIYLRQYQVSGDRQFGQKAAENFQQAFFLAPGNNDIRDSILNSYQLLSSYYSDNLLGSVIASYSEAIFDDKKQVDNYLRLAAVYKKLGKTDKALKVYEDGAINQPDNSEIHINLARAYAHQYQLDLAIRHYELALTLDSNRKDLITELLPLYQQQKHINTSITLLQTLSEHQPNVAWPHIELGKLYLNQFTSLGENNK
ncbi:MAG: hypothetical protein FOGNACKC_00090 [Anaerolineae bacterium]|nr:hypothetical protein [Anaerolineae bacterium]